jgi:hypothetical protein
VRLDECLEVCLYEWLEGCLDEWREAFLDKLLEDHINQACMVAARCRGKQRSVIH